MTTTRKILISAGDSGEFDGVYFTKGKQSPEIGPPSGGFYEGVKNREIAELLTARLRNDGVSAMLMNPSAMSVTESAQVSFARECVKKWGKENVLLLSLHCNADGSGKWTGAHGATCFTKRMDKPSATLGTWLLSAWCGATRIESRGPKTSGFNILFGSPLSVLLEMGFQTNLEDVAALNAQYPAGIAAIADVLKGWAHANY